jgi:CelD/BcsL family acetyltransferase involved in cellulose biosynthesis
MVEQPSLRPRVVAPDVLSDTERSAWSDMLGAHSGLGSAFFSWQFATAVGVVVPHARVCVLQDAEGPRAFFPFQWSAGPLGRLGVAERIGGEVSDYFGLVARPGFKIEPAALLRHAGIASLKFSHLDETQLAFGLTGEGPRVGLRIEFPEGSEAFFKDLRTRKKSLVRETERRLRRLEQDVGPIRFIADAPDRPDLLEQLIQAKTDQYERTGKGRPPLAQPWGQKLVRLLFQRRDPECTGMLSALMAGDDWVALHFGLRCRDTLHYWFPVYNPRHAAAGPGRLLLYKTIEAADSIGLRAIDRGEGDSAVKRDYATSEHTYYMGVWSRPSLGGLVSRAGISLAWRLQAVRRRKGENGEKAEAA